jgi:hypothetical protein
MRATRYVDSLWEVEAFVEETVAVLGGFVSRQE